MNLVRIAALLIPFTLPPGTPPISAKLVSSTGAVVVNSDGVTIVDQGNDSCCCEEIPIGCTSCQYLQICNLTLDTFRNTAPITTTECQSDWAGICKNSDSDPCIFTPFITAYGQTFGIADIVLQQTISGFTVSANIAAQFWDTNGNLIFSGASATGSGHIVNDGMGLSTFPAIDVKCWANIGPDLTTLPATIKIRIAGTMSEGCSLIVANGDYTLTKSGGVGGDYEYSGPDSGGTTVDLLFQDDATGRGLQPVFSAVGAPNSITGNYKIDGCEKTDVTASNYVPLLPAIGQAWTVYNPAYVNRTITRIG